MIPHTFHRIWLGSPVPEKFDAYWYTWKRFHPGWEFITWGEGDLDWLKNRDLFDAAETWAEKADIARYEIIERFGGVYVDADFECLANIESTLDGVRAFSAREDASHIAIGIMGAELGHPLFSTVTGRLWASCVAHKEQPVNFRTGPVFFTEIAKDFPGVTIFGPELFYPYHYSQPDPGVYPGALAVHHWTASWT